MEIDMFTNEEDQATFDSYTKEQIYEAYLVEVEARKALNKAMNTMQRNKPNVEAMILSWVASNPKRYYKNGVLYGLISTVQDEEVLHVYGMALHNRFTYNMIKDTIMYAKQQIICLYVDTVAEQPKLLQAFARYTISTQYDGSMLKIYCNIKE